MNIVPYAPQGSYIWIRIVEVVVSLLGEARSGNQGQERVFPSIAQVIRLRDSREQAKISKMKPQKSQSYSKSMQRGDLARLSELDAFAQLSAQPWKCWRFL